LPDVGERRRIIIMWQLILKYEVKPHAGTFISLRWRIVILPLYPTLNFNYFKFRNGIFDNYVSTRRVKFSLKNLPLPNALQLSPNIFESVYIILTLQGYTNIKQYRRMPLIRTHS
jgi:hypothetical protein